MPNNLLLPLAFYFCLISFKMVWSKRFIPKLFVWHSSRDTVRMKWRYYRTGLYTEKKRSHWLKQWPIRKGVGDKKRRVVIGWRCNLDFVKMLEQSTNGKFKRLRRSSRSRSGKFRRSSFWQYPRRVSDEKLWDESLTSRHLQVLYHQTSLN